MVKPIKQLVKKMFKNGELISFGIQDMKNGVNSNYASCYMKGKKVLFRGECNMLTSSTSTSRNMLLTVTDGKTQKILGKFY